MQLSHRGRRRLPSSRPSVAVLNYSRVYLFVRRCEHCLSTVQYSYCSVCRYMNNRYFSSDFVGLYYIRTLVCTDAAFLSGRIFCWGRDPKRRGCVSPVTLRRGPAVLWLRRPADRSFYPLVKCVPPATAHLVCFQRTSCEVQNIKYPLILPYYTINLYFE